MPGRAAGGDLTTSLREIYYRTKHTMKGSHENTFDGQNESDPLIEDLEVTLAACARSCTSERRTPAACGAGRARRRRRPGGLRAAGKGGYSCPPSSSPNSFRSADARRTSSARREGHQWNRLSEDNSGAATTACCSLGMASRPRRASPGARLHEEYEIPVYVLVDNDRGGITSTRSSSRIINLASRASAWPFPRPSYRTLQLGCDTYGPAAQRRHQAQRQGIGRPRSCSGTAGSRRTVRRDQAMLASGLK